MVVGCKYHGVVPALLQRCFTVVTVLLQCRHIVVGVLAFLLLGPKCGFRIPERSTNHPPHQTSCSL
jgi:hypothetical protein